MSHKNRLTRLNDATVGISITIEPILAPLISKLKGVDIKNGPIKRTMTAMDESPQDMSDVIIVLRGFINETKKEIRLLESYIHKNEKKIEANNVQGEVIDDIIENINGVVLFTSELLSLSFMEFDDLPQAKRVQTIGAISEYVSVYEAFKNGDVVDNLNNITAGVPKNMIDGFTDKKNATFIVGFNGNPFFVFGKLLARFRQRRSKLLEMRIKYIRLEIMELEMKGNPKLLKEIEYYKAEILTMEMEISELSNKYE